LRTLFADVSGVDSVLEASDLAEARQVLAERTPDFVVLDLHLRTGNGLGLLKDLKLERPEIRVIVLTNDATDHHRRSCAALGADYFFDKSTQFEAVLQVLELEGRRRQR
jgi:two-component system, OmpR family, response regulator